MYSPNAIIGERTMLNGAQFLFVFGIERNLGYIALISFVSIGRSAGRAYYAPASSRIC